jgi:hypothetical protein
MKTDLTTNSSNKSIISLFDIKGATQGEVVFINNGEMKHGRKSIGSVLTNVYPESNFIDTPDFERVVEHKDEDSTRIGSSSDFMISRNGNIVETWSSVELIPAKLIELNRDSVILECLVDVTKKEFELRSFKRSLLEGKVSFAVNKILLIKIFERPGKFVMEFDEGNNMGFEELFEFDEDIASIDMGSYLR